MAGESGGGEHRTPEPTFADVMNGFSFDSGRSAKRRRWGRRRDDEQPGQPDEQPGPVDPSSVDPRPADFWPSDPRGPEPGPVPGNQTVESIGRFDRGLADVPEQPPPPWPSQPGHERFAATPRNPAGPLDDDQFDPADPARNASASVRPYAWTRGRTRSGLDLQLETLVSTSTRGRDQLALLAFEHRSVAELCERAQSVAEVAALLSVPLGVAKVLVGDMAGMGLVVVHRSGGSNGDAPDLALMERVLSGLRRL